MGVLGQAFWQKSTNPKPVCSSAGGPLWHLFTFCNGVGAAFLCLITACLLKLYSMGLLQLPVEDET